MRSSRHALMPLLFAERDREYLKQLKRNRAEEDNLMKNVRGWETGTWFGKNIYKTLPEDNLLILFSKSTMFMLLIKRMLSVQTLNYIPR